jgi:hypothetical protein
MAAQTFGLRLFQTFELWGSHPKLRSPFPGTLCSLPMEYAFGKLPEHRVAAKRAASPFGIEDCVANSTSPFPPGPTYLQVLSGRPGARGSTLQGLREDCNRRKSLGPWGFPRHRPVTLRRSLDYRRHWGTLHSFAAGLVRIAGRLMLEIGPTVYFSRMS